MKRDRQIIIITPVYEDIDASSKLFKELAELFGEAVYIVAIDDGSIKQPLSISDLVVAGVDGVVLKIKRNVGHQRAIAVGLAYVSEYIQPDQRVVVMDSDGEDRPDTVPILLAQLDVPDIDLVVAQRKSRVETFRFKAFYAIYKLIFHAMTGREISFGNYMALKSHSVKRLTAMKELPIHVASTVLASKLRATSYPIDRGPRYAGQSKMNFVGLVLHGFKGMMVFAEDVLVRVGIASGAVAAMTVLGILIATLLKFYGYATPGWFSIALGIMTLIFIQTGALALTTLMMTGLVRDNIILPSNHYLDYLIEIENEDAF